MLRPPEADLLRLLVVAVLVCVTWSCTRAPARATAPEPRSELPAWALGAEPSDAHTLRGVGSGATLELATRAALQDVASSLWVSISSESIDRRTRIGEYEREELRLVLESEVAETRFQGWRRDRIARVDGRYHVLVLVDRSQLVSSYVRELRALEALIGARLEGAGAASPLRYWASYERSRPELQRIDQLAQLLAAADPAFDPSRQASHLETWAERQEEARGRIVIGIHADAGGNGAAQVVEGLLQEAALPTRWLRDCRDAAIACVHVSGQSHHNQVAGRHVATLESRWVVHDLGGDVVAEVSRVDRGSSVQSASQATSNALTEMRTSLEAEGILVALGLP